MHSGHYCYVKAATGVWYEMDDEGVSATSERTALNRRRTCCSTARGHGSGRPRQGGSADRTSGDALLRG